MSAGPHIFLLAGESSGDRLGAALMRRLREETNNSVRFSGVGGEAMIAEGLDPVFPMRDIAVMGLVEVVPHLPRLIGRLRQASDAVERLRPDALVTIDAQVFASKLGQRVRRRAPETALVHYVAPTVWAWKPGRAKKLAGYLDRVLALFPFEPPYFERHGLTCDFVGHPVTERVARVPDSADAKLRAELGIAPEAPVLLVAPGSRKSEIARLAAPFGDAARKLRTRIPGLEVIVPVAASVADEVRMAVGQWGVPVHLLDPLADFETAETRKFAAFAAADVALAASGTVTLELAAMGVPHIVGYRMPRLNEFIARRMMSIDTGTLVNIILGEKIVPEYFQGDCNGDTLSAALLPLFEDGEARAAQISGFAAALDRLRKDDEPPSVRAARSVLAAIEAKRQRFSTGT